MYICSRIHQITNKLKPYCLSTQIFTLDQKVNCKTMSKYSDLSEEELALLYADGDNKAFDALLERTQQRLFTYIMFVVHNHDVADDIFQDTFVKAIVQLQQGKYTDSGKFFFWITRIAHNVIMDWYRQQAGERLVDPTEDNDLNNLRCASVLDSHRETQLVNEQVLRDVKKMVYQLPPAQREVVYMRYYQQIPFKEIAEMTGVSINTALGRMRYALLNMRRMARENKIELALQE